MHMHAAGAALIRSRARAAAERLVDAKRRVAKEHIVHRALTFRGQIKRIDEQRDNRLTGFDIARNDGRTTGGIRIKLWIEHAAGNVQIHRAQEAFVHGHLFIDQQTQRIEHRSLRDCARRVEVAWMNLFASFEANRQAIINYFERHCETRAVIEKPLRCARTAQRVQSLREHALCAIEFALATRCEIIGSAFTRECLDSINAMTRRGHLRKKISEILLRIARGIWTVGEARPHRGFIKRACAHREKRRQHHALFGEVLGVGRKRTRPRATDLRVMRAHGDVAHACSLEKHWSNRGDIR